MTSTTPATSPEASMLLLQRHFLPMDCPTAVAIANVIDGAAERAVLIDASSSSSSAPSSSEEPRGKILHMNTAAINFLYVDDTNPHITDFLVFDNEDVVDSSSSATTSADSDWTSITRCRVRKKDGVPTLNARNITWASTTTTTINDNTSTAEQQNRKYLVAYICSKHERVREVMDHAFDPVVTTDEHGVIRTANKAAYDLFGYNGKTTELAGQNVSVLCGDGQSQHHDSYIKRYNQTKENHIVGSRREVMGRKKDGTEFPCELGVQEFNDVSTGLRFFCGYFKDLTQLKLHEAEMEERQALAQGMINASFDSMFEIDEDGIIQLVNDSACSMFGYTREEFVGNNISIICGGGEAKNHDMYMKRYLESGVARIIGRKRQVRAKRKDGSEFDVELGVQEVKLATTGKAAFCGFIRDLTQQKKDKRALRKQQQIIHGKFFGTEEEENGSEP